MAQDKEYEDLVAKCLLDEDALKAEYKEKREKLQNDNINIKQKINTLKMNEQELLKKNEELQCEIKKNSLKLNDEIKVLNEKISNQKIDLNAKVIAYEDLEEKYNNLITSNKNILSNEKNNQEKFTYYANEITELKKTIELVMKKYFI